MFVEPLLYTGVRFFSSDDATDDNGPLLLRSAADVYDGYTAEDTDIERLRRLVLIGEYQTVTDVRGHFYFGLYLHDPPDGLRVVDVWGIRNVGLTLMQDGVDSFAELLALLRDG